MNEVLIANIIALIGSIFMVAASYSKINKRSVIYQSIQIFAFIISNIILGGITGIIINSLSLLRNLLTSIGKLNNIFKYGILLLIVILTIIFNNLGFIGYLPLIGTVIFTIFIDSKDRFKFKMSLTFSIFMWLIYDFYIMSYTSAMFDLVSVIGGIILMFKIKVKL